MNVKYPIGKDHQKGVGYSIPCSQCNQCYVGEAGRTLYKRKKEHDYAVRIKDHNNTISRHAWEKGHLPLLKEARVLANEDNMVKRKILEEIKIKSIDRTFSLDEGMKLHDAWNIFFTPP